MAYGQLAHTQSIMASPTAGSSLGHESNRTLLPHVLLAPHSQSHQVASNEHLCSVQTNAH